MNSGTNKINDVSRQPEIGVWAKRGHNRSSVINPNLSNPVQINGIFNGNTTEDKI